MKKKLTPLQRQYQKEYRRLRKGFAKYSKEGFIFPEESLPQSPKRVTQKLLETIKQIKPKQLTLFGEKYNTETGEIERQEKKVSPTKISKSKPKRKVQTKQIQKAKVSEAIVSDYIQIQSPPVTQEYIPTLTIIDAIRSRIQELPDKTLRGRGVPIAGRRNALLDILEDTLMSMTQEETEAYEQYLKSQQDIIFKELDLIQYESKEERIDASFANVGRILNNGSTLTAMQAESLNSMQEMYVNS